MVRFDCFSVVIFSSGLWRVEIGFDFRIAELREALDEQCGLFEVCRIVAGRILPEDLRVRAWQVGWFIC